MERKNSSFDLKKWSHIHRITFDTVIISSCLTVSSIFSATALTLQKLHDGPFLGLKSSESTASTSMLVTLYSPSSRSSWSKSFFKVSGRLLISSPSSSTTCNHYSLNLSLNSFSEVLPSLPLIIVTMANPSWLTHSSKLEISHISCLTVLSPPSCLVLL